MNAELSGFSMYTVQPSLYWAPHRPKEPAVPAPSTLCLVFFPLPLVGEGFHFTKKGGGGSLVPKACLFSLLICLSSSEQSLNDFECTLIWNGTLILLFHAWLQLKSRAKFKNTTLL